ncbi:uncharacterized protein CIMG_13742 [Coccidioides immitis RS]|uniref:Uncharacterized protein n=1 Tax=Coccidioides immitis (strain RS) TaxID=246410 RepID=A0A0D8JW56_COCIM|nr:uncharacterized protein CIMG_13742 [Coccidioides immitis RS]KJF61560.1 hypothetical protein CIMG_13742 [Coccidioides immitis RS]
MGEKRDKIDVWVVRIKKTCEKVGKHSRRDTERKPGGATPGFWKQSTGGKKRRGTWFDQLHSSEIYFGRCTIEFGSMSYRGFGGCCGLGTPVVSYAPRPIFVAERSLSIMTEFCDDAITPSKQQQQLFAADGQCRWRKRRTTETGRNMTDRSKYRSGRRSGGDEEPASRAQKGCRRRVNQKYQEGEEKVSTEPAGGRKDVLILSRLVQSPYETAILFDWHPYPGSDN